MERIRHLRRVSQRSAEWQYGSRSSEDVRIFLLRLVLDFIRTARQVSGVERIALIGSLTRRKRYPHDADVLVSINESIDFASLAGAGRRFKGKAQGINSGADIFLAEKTERTSAGCVSIGCVIRGWLAARGTAGCARISTMIWILSRSRRRSLRLRRLLCTQRSSSTERRHRMSRRSF